MTTTTRASSSHCAPPVFDSASSRTGSTPSISRAGGKTAGASLCSFFCLPSPFLSLSIPCTACSQISSYQHAQLSLSYTLRFRNPIPQFTPFAFRVSRPYITDRHLPTYPSMRMLYRRSPPPFPTPSHRRYLISALIIGRVAYGYARG